MRGVLSANSRAAQRILPRFGGGNAYTNPVHAMRKAPRRYHSGSIDKIDETRCILIDSG